MKKGFTLIELLVVVSIIGLLASIIFVQFGGVTGTARDAKAKVELSNIRTAFELCYNVVTPGVYPPFGGTGWVDIPVAQEITCEGTTFMKPVPTTAGVNPYQWNDFGNVQKYGLRVNLEESGCFTITEEGLVETTSGECL